MKATKLLKDISKHLLFEVPSILIAVLLALGLTTWKEDRAIQKLTDTAVNQIFSDISRVSGFLYANEINEKAVEELQIRIDSLQIQEEKDLSNRFAIVELNMNSWESFNSNSNYTTRISFELYSDLKFVMDEYENYARAVKQYRDFKISYNPEMKASTIAKYLLRYQREILFRGSELSRKKIDLQEKYPHYFQEK